MASAAANRVCRREQARIAALPARSLGSLEAQKRVNVIEEDARSRSSSVFTPERLCRRNFVAWRGYEVKLDIWLLGRLEVGDRPAAVLGTQRIESAHAYSPTLARRISADSCARP